MNRYLLSWSGALTLLLAMTLTGCGNTERPGTGSESGLGRRAASLSTATGSMSKYRADFSTTRLLDGQVLVVGGEPPQSGGSAELYDPFTGTFSSTLNMPSGLGRGNHVAVRLDDGSVLVMGGGDMTGWKAQALRFNTASGMWSSAGTMLQARMSHTATVLSDGRVLVVGGQVFGSAFTSCELFNPATGTWTSAAPMNTGRKNHIAARLPDGRVLVTGGDDANTAELYDPATNTWSYTGSPLMHRHSAVGLTLANGRVLVMGGESPTFNALLGGAELYNPVTGTWSAAGTMNKPRIQHTAVVLSTGTVLVFGGFDGTYLSSVERFEPSTMTWSETGAMLEPRARHGVELLSNDRVLLVGGANPSILASAELYTYGATCLPTTCAAQGKNCGTLSDGCGGTLTCGGCPGGQVCSASNVCTAATSDGGTPSDPLPTAQVLEPFPGFRVQGSVALLADATDDQGVTRVDFYVDSTLVGSDTSAPYQSTWDTLGSTNGSHNVSAIAHDTAGQSTTSALVQVTVANDRQAPTVSVSQPIQDQRTSGVLPVQVSFSDDTGVFQLELYLDGSTLFGRNYDHLSSGHVRFNLDTTQVADGPHSVSALVIDSVGKVTQSVPVRFFVDNTPPPGPHHLASPGLGGGGARHGDGGRDGPAGNHGRGAARGWSREGHANLRALHLHLGQPDGQREHAHPGGPGHRPHGEPGDEPHGVCPHDPGRHAAHRLPHRAARGGDGVGGAAGEAQRLG
jgi:hypothetical protein